LLLERLRGLPFINGATTGGWHKRLNNLIKAVAFLGPQREGVKKVLELQGS